MKFVLKSLINSLHKYRSIYQPTAFLSQNSKKNEGEPRKNMLSRNYKSKNNAKTIAGIIIGSTVVGYIGYRIYDSFVADGQINLVKPSLKNVSSVGQFIKGLPYYSVCEISKHNTRSSMWVTYKEGVYDITEYIPSHPGGEQIMMAAGTGIDPFWFIYTVHDKDYVYEMLEDYRIGNLQKDDLSQIPSDVEDLFAKEPTRHPGLIPISQKPFCGGCDSYLLPERFLTPNEFFYVRNHLFVPDLDAETYKIDIEVEGRSKTFTFTLDELKKMPKHTITSTLMCYGNRRDEMTKVKPIQAVMWSSNAIGCAVWAGVRLADIMKLIGVEDDGSYHHVHFEGHDHDAAGTHFSGSIPIWRAFDRRRDVLLAYEMNGVPLTRDHGFPLRLFAPGIAGVRMCKWIRKITVSENESKSYWMHRDYKPFSPGTDFSNVDYDKSPAVQELPITSGICQPRQNDTVKVVDGTVLVKGYAWSGNGQKIIRVDVTADGGKSWHIADLDMQGKGEVPQHYTWTLWSMKVPVPKGATEVEVWAKAVDSSCNTQPESFENIFNFRGVICNAYYRLKLNLIY